MTMVNFRAGLGEVTVGLSSFPIESLSRLACTPASSYCYKTAAYHQYHRCPLNPLWNGAL